MTKVLVVGQTPPPYHGQAVMIEQLVRADLDDVQLIHVRMAFSTDIDDVGRVRFAKVVQLFWLIARIIYHRFADRVRILYYPPAGPDKIPVLRDIIILLSVRWLFDKTVFHFHIAGVSALYARLPAWQRWFFRAAYFKPDAAIMLSPLSPDDGRQFQAKRTWFIPNGIPDPYPSDCPLEAQASSPECRPLRILYVGILRESKGTLTLLDACAELSRREIPFQLDLVGKWESEEFEKRGRQRIAESKLHDRVKFLGVLVGKPKFDAFRRADVLCHPTHFDTFPTVLLEAMAAGIPVVSTTLSGIPSIVNDGETGFLVAPRDSAAVADRLACFASDSALRRRMGAAGRRKFERELSLPRHLARMREVFQDVVRPERQESRHAHFDTAAKQTSVEATVAKGF
jgi:glycosyltransferase involved in cell wall biosynthesis